ncbi:GntR family transcriptional regulator [Sphingobium sp. B2D3A]|uniref:GntR family transcriptional regulator n=1 Tax=Sphingobium TaxID=165695 RepID=UPI0017D0F46A|nr:MULTISPECIES: GntR family transcriptional regulator [Sphingobium]MCW2336686.1 GntR family transcriptional regulator [Sphingobium sp. B2D3A]MCW2363112.1 GntR family transcriptional regulator [Sphingobium sp. B10D3B]MCW2368286.1 GntR family transcriptional regulator [Sphingobium sp. B11D3D]MCW2386440.1 GntR family transcriptional regulator [Sphingobium sp. B2D3D]MCW2400208.1 GntR family transcriptional regulator [Sphingobium sp. B10D7B]
MSTHSTRSNPKGPGGRPAGAADLGSRGIARYHQLAAVFRRHIETGVWEVGSQIPTVVELALSYDVARETVRQALGMLAEEGLIRRYRAKGTFVTGAPRDQIWCQLETNFLGLLQAREGAQIELIGEERKVGIAGTIEFGVADGAYRKLSRRHWRDDQPYMIAEVFISERWANKIPRAAFTSKTALKLVADIDGLAIADVEQIMTIGVADLDASVSLQIPLNAPVAQIERYVVDADGILVLFARNTYRGDVVRLNIKSK